MNPPVHELQYSPRPFTKLEDPAEDAAQQLKQRTRRYVLVALFLSFMGVFLLALGYAMYLEGHKRVDYLSCFVLGVICLLPGSYSTTLVWGAYQEWPGYEWDNLEVSFVEMDE